MSVKKINSDKSEFVKQELDNICTTIELERKKLHTKLSDSKINLSINRNNLISLNKEKNEIFSGVNNSGINQLNTDNVVLLEKFSNTYKLKIQKERQLNKLMTNLDNRLNWERDKISNCNNEIYYMNTKLKEKDQIIENLKYEIDRYITLDLEFHKEIYLTDPKKNNIDIVNEITYTKDIIQKINNLYDKEKLEKEKLDTEINVLQKDYETLNRNKTCISTLDNSKKDNKQQSTLLNRQSKSLAKNKNEYYSGTNLNFTSEMNTNKQMEESTNLRNIQGNLNHSKISKDSAYESDVILEIQDNENLEEIQNIKFPDKVMMKISTNKKNSDLPKLDMSRVYQKYQSQSNVHIVKPIKKKELFNYSNSISKIGLNKKNSLQTKKNSLNSMTMKINNLKSDLSQTKDTIKELEITLYHIKKSFKENRSKQSKIKENLKVADSKIENLKNQIKLLTNKEITDDLDQISSSDSSDEIENSQEYSYCSYHKENDEGK